MQLWKYAYPTHHRTIFFIMHDFVMWLSRSLGVLGNMHDVKKLEAFEYLAVAGLYFL